MPNIVESGVWRVISLRAIGDSPIGVRPECLLRWTPFSLK
jgi:hypothetical protein